LIDPVELRSPQPMLDRNARSIEDKISYSGRFEKPVQPKDPS